MNGIHDVRVPAGPQAAALFDLWNVMLVTCAVVFVAILVALAIALWRAPRATEQTAPDLASHPRKEAALRRSVGYAIAASAVLLFVLLFASFVADRAIATLPLDDAVHIDLIGHQFWWEARYDPNDPARVFSTANELHVPVGRPVLMRLRADDVIHSFWVPSLAGKKDLIPGRESTMAFRADLPGTYRGQCAEFCGYQHAHMALVVVADAPAVYDRWLALQRQPAREPATAEEQRGRDLVEHASCAMCHTIAGTAAKGRRAPDLTHVGSRAWLAAGTLPNTAAARAHWIADPQQYKPGVDMPPLAAAPTDLVAISAYLGSLQ
ncbi:MAG TPA: cytochrome c oxidase subunit II [Casimicrobiaceae bacterium]|jgi:cytochrome c oxidase subunit 2